MSEGQWKSARRDNSDGLREWTDRAEYTIKLSTRLSLEASLLNSRQTGRPEASMLWVRGIDVENTDRIFALLANADADEIHGLGQELIAAAEHLRKYKATLDAPAEPNPCAEVELDMHADEFEVGGDLRMTALRLCPRHAAERRARFPDDDMVIIDGAPGASSCLACFGEGGAS